MQTFKLETKFANSREYNTLHTFNYMLLTASSD